MNGYNITVYKTGTGIQFTTELMGTQAAGEVYNQIKQRFTEIDGYFVDVTYYRTEVHSSRCTKGFQDAHVAQQKAIERTLAKETEDAFTRTFPP